MKMHEMQSHLQPVLLLEQLVVQQLLPSDGVAQLHQQVAGFVRFKQGLEQVVLLLQLTETVM